MKWLTFRVQKRPGFRFNLTDLGLIACLLSASWALYTYMPGTAIHYFPLYVGISFFLFCNVFRVGNRIEPLWYIPFGIAMMYSVYRMEVDWTLLLLIFVPLQIALILYRVIRGPYLGILYEKVGKYDRGLVADESSIDDREEY